MKCTACGSANLEDSKYCQQCGVKLAVSQENIKRNPFGQILDIRDKNDALAEKCAEIFRSGGFNKESPYASLSSKAVQDLLDTMGNTAQVFISNCLEFDSGKFWMEVTDIFMAVVPDMRKLLSSFFSRCGHYGYVLWIAEALLEKNDLHEAPEIKYKKLHKRWTEIAIDNEKESNEKIGKDVKFEMGLMLAPLIDRVINESKESIERYRDYMKLDQNYREDGIGEPKAWDSLPPDLKEKLAHYAYTTLRYGYFAGMAESTFRK